MVDISFGFRKDNSIASTPNKQSILSFIGIFLKLNDSNGEEFIGLGEHLVKEHRGLIN